MIIIRPFLSGASDFAQVVLLAIISVACFFSLILLLGLDEEDRQLALQLVAEIANWPGSSGSGFHFYDEHEGANG